MKPDISAVVINRNGHVVFTVYGSFDRENTPHVFEGITPLFKDKDSFVAPVGFRLAGVFLFGIHHVRARVTPFILLLKIKDQ